MSIFEIMTKVNELIEDRSYLESMKAYMDITYEFDNCEQEFAYDCIIEELKEVEEQLDYYMSIYTFMINE
jgi:hypothetical protein